IGTLAGGIAHDFNNILAAIVGYNELAQEAAKDEPELLEYLQEVHCAALRARNLVRQILTFSRKSNKDNEPLQMSLLVQESLKMLRSTIPASIEIKQNISTKAKVFADPTQIHQVIMNLCTNAYQAMRETGGVLGVSLREVVLPNESFVLEAKPGKYLLLEVSDTGAGIDKERMDKIFEPYFTTKDKGQGTGLGLAVVYGIVQSLDGHLTLDSEPGKGSTFQIYLPVHAGEVRLPEANPEPVDRGSERIMLIDDEELIVKMTASNLSASGYQVSTFTDGEEALKRFLDNPDGYDLVITDMTMPKMSGAELAQNILERHPDVPIILCTGYNETINRSKALALGIKGYLEKPILRNDLLRAVREALD
ncbi:MAG: response regulator, partial [Desulfobulbaceae bacterium]|nr:response regulator [Desulfobulbaceae bacterium]